MGYDRGDSFHFDFEPNGHPFGSKLKGKLSPRSYPIQSEWKYSFLSASTKVSPVAARVGVHLVKTPVNYLAIFLQVDCTGKEFVSEN